MYKNIPKDLFISVAAVSDWKIKNYNKNKIKKRNSSISFQLKKIKISLNIYQLITIGLSW